MNRRGFLGAMLAAAVAPAFVKAESLMPLWVPSKEIITFDTSQWVHVVHHNVQDEYVIYVDGKQYDSLSDALKKQLTPSHFNHYLRTEGDFSLSYWLKDGSDTFGTTQVANIYLEKA